MTSTSYNTASQATSVTYGSGDSDSFSFDPNTQLPLGYTINVGTKAQTASITQNLNHTMRQLSITDTIFSNENQTCNFGYDEFARLTSANCGSVWGADYAYDIFGNMNKTMIAGSPGTSFIPTYDTSNHYATLPAGTPSYDNNGNLLNDSFHTYSWDNEGNPVTIDSYSLTYDALDRRVEYGTGSSFTQYLYAPFDATLNLGAAAALASPGLRIPTPGGGRAILGASGVTDYRRPNWQQSEPVDSSTTGTALSDASYTPYGEHYEENGYSGFFAANLSIYPVFTDGYAGTWRLYHYDQNRWISPDPAGLSAVDPSDPQTWNRYSYARGNPLGNTDPSGLCSDYDPPCTGPIFYAVGIACHNWWNIFCWLGGSNGTSPLPPSQYQASNAGVNPNSGNPGAQSGSTGQGGGVAALKVNASNKAVSCEVDSRAAHIPGGQLLHAIGINHQWITTTAGVSAGMGTARGVPQSDYPGVQTQVVNHAGEVPDSRVTYGNIDPAALSTYLKMGSSTGPWIPGINDCNTWVAGAVNNSTPHNLTIGIYGVPITYATGVVVYADGSIHPPGGN